MENKTATRKTFQAYKRAEMAAYERYFSETNADGPNDKFNAALKMWLNRTKKLVLGNFSDDDVIPGHLLQSYETPPGDRIAASIQIKYQLKGLNSLREYLRTRAYTPELVNPKGRKKYRILNPSAGAAGLTSALAPYGHTVDINDFFDQPEFGNPERYGPSYRWVHEELGIDCPHFDGRERPYAYADQSYDYVFCHQAIDVYGSIDEWPDIIDDFRRIAVKKVALVLNPPANHDGLPRAVHKVQRREKLAQFVESAAKSFRGKVSSCPETLLPALVVSGRKTVT